MQIFTYKKRDFDNLNIHATRIDNQALFFLSDIQSQTMAHWVLMGFDWTLSYRTYPEMIDLARKLRAILCIFENAKLISNEQDHKFTVKKSETITARAQKKWYTVTATKGDYIESVEVGPSLPPTQEGNGTMRIAHGEGVILSCTLLPDTTDYTYDFDGWYDSNVKVQNEGTTAAIDPVIKNINWTAKGKRTATPDYSLTAKAVFKAIGSDTYVESTEGGTVTPTSGSYKNGVKVTLTSEVAADTETAGYLFDGYFTGMNDGNNLSYSKTYGIR